jgi:hypothetical protein
MRITGSGSDGGGTTKSDAFARLANGVDLSYTVSPYRAGTGNSQVQTTAVSPYSISPGGGITVSFGAPATNTIGFSIVCADQGGDDGDADAVIVNSNIDVDLTFTMSLLNISNTAGITQYTPTVTFAGAWSYSG